jgi:proteasome lid subunit RPN8/RPN11
VALHKVTSKIYIPMEVIIPAILAYGLEERPFEACGVIVPNLNEAPGSWVRKMINRADNPMNSYRLDPEMIQQLSADLTPEEDQQRVWEDVIVWHTHPSGSVGPSAGDMEYRVEGLKYLVVSIPNGEAVLF